MNVLFKYRGLDGLGKTTPSNVATVPRKGDNVILPMSDGTGIRRGLFEVSSVVWDLATLMGPYCILTYMEEA